MKRLFFSLLFLLLFLSPSLAVSCFWVGGTGTWDQTNTGGGGAGGIKWASATGGGTACAAVSGPAAGVPGPSDTATFDGASGGGTVTLNFGGTITLQAITMGAFTGTFENSVNNNNITVTNSGSAFSITGSGTRTIKLGSATYTLSNNVIAKWDATTVTNLTLTAGTSVISFTGAQAQKSMVGGSGKTYSTVQFSASTTGFILLSTAQTIGTLTVTAPNALYLPSAATTTISTAINLVGSASSPIGVFTDTIGTPASLALPAAQTAQWSAFREITVTGNALVATNSLDLLHNTLITITPPQAVGAGGGTLIGG